MGVGPWVLGHGCWGGVLVEKLFFGPVPAGAERLKQIVLNRLKCRYVGVEMKRSLLLTAGLLLVVAYIGCNKSPEPRPEATHVAQASPTWTSVTLRIDGFKKSKSGAT